MSKAVYFKGQQVRFLVIKGRPWFVAMDICAAFVICWDRKSLSGIPRAWLNWSSPDDFKAKQAFRLVSLPAVYELAFRAGKTEIFEEWFALEMIPAVDIETDEWTVSTKAERGPLRTLLGSWATISGRKPVSLWAKVRFRFDLSRTDSFPVSRLPDAIVFVQSRIDRLKEDQKV